MTAKLDKTPTLPQYVEEQTPQNPFTSINRLSTSSSSSIAGDARSITTAPPPYDDSLRPPFLPTIELRIDTPGKPLISLPTPLRPDPIPIFAVSPSPSPSPQFLSLRPTRSSGSCYLTSPSESETALSTTTYRFGPGPPPLINLFLPGTCPSPPQLSSSPSPSSSEVNLSTYSTFAITSPSLLSRSTTFTVPQFGTFTWRYASRTERHAFAGPAGAKPHSLLLLEKIILVSHAHQAKPTETRTLVAQLVRGEGTRAEGSSASSAGNGGVLSVDVDRIAESRGDGEEEEEKQTDTKKEMALVMVVTTALVMLKKEVDRRRAQQIAVLSGAGY